MRAYRSSTPSRPSWIALGEARRRGQRPAGAVWVTDHENQRYLLQAVGAYVLDLPLPQQAIFAAGLTVLMLGRRNTRTSESAMDIACARPGYFAIYWRGEGAEVVIS